MERRPAVRTRNVAARSQAGRKHGHVASKLLAALLIVAALAGIGLYASRPSKPDPNLTPTPVIAPSRAEQALGAVDTPATESIVGTRIAISGWSLHPAGIASVEARVGDRRHAARTGLPRPDVAQALPGHPGNDHAGFMVEVEVGEGAMPTGVDRLPIRIVAIDRHGGETVLGARSLIAAGATTRWKPYASAGPAFHLLPALSGIGLGHAQGLDTFYANYVSPTTRVGTRVPILYLRTTKGAAGDYAFDPEWDTGRRCKPGEDTRRLSDDSLAGVIRYAIAKQLPILFTLNGGIWGDAACDMPDWDVNDRLEQDKANCQWSEKNEVVADDHLKNLAGAFDSPELARALTLNVHASEVRRYKKRNLQQAATHIARFAREHPHLFVGVTLEPDLYMNPFFGEQAWFDYNPATLRQFREWLAGSGPYAGRGDRSVPDLRKYRRADPLTLQDVGRLTGRQYKRWDEVDPPRSFPREGAVKFWDDRWTREWEHYRRHLVDLHYDELSTWVAEAGIARERIWSAQGFMAPHDAAMPFAVGVRSPVKNYDSGGMSVEGSKPVAGHLGSILYGASAQNDIRMEGPRSLFGTFAAIDPAWAVVEYNAADLRQPKRLPTYADAYRGLREMWNHGARFVSPMAWTGSNGRNAGKPGYDPFTAWRETPLEEAAKDFLLARTYLPPGSKLWTFGAAGHADTDGWTAERGSIASHPGHLVIAPDASLSATLVSPPELLLDTAAAWRVVLLTEQRSPVEVVLWGRSQASDPWRRIGGGAGTADAIRLASSGHVDQLRIELKLGDAQPLPLIRVAIIPDAPRGAVRSR